MNQIALTKGFVAIVDSDFVTPYKWSYSSGYALRATNKGVRFYLHRVIVGAQKGQYVDHINGNRLDCRLENLRLCTNAQNAWGFRKLKNKYRGVTYDARNSRYIAQLTCNYVRHYLGQYKTAEEAARAYDVAATLHFGEFAQRNF